MRKVLKNELEVAASADDIWAVFRSPDLPRLLVDTLLPGAFEKIEILAGDGGVGTILNIRFPPGVVPRGYVEKFILMDDKRRLKKVQMIRGGYLDMGATFYMDSFHVLEDGHNSCIIVSKITYEVPDELADNVEPYINIESLESMSKAIANFVIARKRSYI